jgi:hypothetical protein
MAPAAPGTLAARLAAVRGLDDLSFLVRYAGGSVRHREFTLPFPAAGITGGRTLGGHAGCRWVAFDCSGPPERVAAALARRLEREPEVTCLVVLNPGLRLLAVGISLAPFPAMGLSLDAPGPVALRCLERLRGGSDDDGLVAAARIARALDGQAAGRRFFEAFRQLLDRMRAALPGRIPAADRHALALLDLTRTLFLYFVQAKGWLDGRSRFLAEEVDHVLSTGRHLHADLLRPLFFGTLNQPPARRGAAPRRFGAIPFLNGGLFELHPLERRWRPTWPNELLRDAFDQVFERFHFTADEAEGNAIAPDMLGRVFEGVMDPEERGATGTFYTPAALVDDVLSAAFEAQLAERLGCGAEEASRRLGDPDPATRATLLGLRILDPAVGSGAFLLGAFQRLRSLAGADPRRVGHAVLSRNLFGVDLSPAAVRLTELRLWLAVISGDTAEDPAEVAPLPNLDTLVRSGDSLGLVRPPTPGGIPTAVAERVRAGRAALLVAVGADKRAAVRDLRAAEQEAAAALLTSRLESVGAQLRDLAAVRRSPTLFGDRRGLTGSERRTLEQWRAERSFLHAARRRLDREGALPWFEYQAQFADVFAGAGGFDLVVGNPPWVRAEELPAPMRAALAGRFRWWGGGGRRGYRHQPDLAVAFLERAVELAAPRGTVAMLVPAKVATAGYGTRARAALVRGHTLHRVADLSHEPHAAFDATVYPMAIVAGKGAAAAGHAVRFSLRAQGESRPQAGLSGAPWVLVSGTTFEALERGRGEHPRLHETFRAALGVKTGCNAVFLDPPGPVEPELLRWAVRGRDVRAFHTAPRCRLLWTHDDDGRPLVVLPPRATQWLERHRAVLRGRADWQGGSDWMVFRTQVATRPHRVIWPDLARRLDAATLAHPGTAAIPLNTCYVIAARNAQGAQCLTAWLNSTWLRAMAAATADPAAGGCRRFKASVIESLPLPAAVLADGDLATLAEAGARGSLTQHDLDDACNRHLGLGAAHRRALARLVPGPRHRRG